MRVKIKICGLARAVDARLAAELGADFLGLVLARSPRGVVPSRIATWVQELRAEFPRSAWVGVFVRPGLEEMERAVETLQLDYVQIHGMPPDWVPDVLPRPWIRVLDPNAARGDRSAGPEPFATLIDTPGEAGYGGTGRVFDWKRLGPLPEGRRVLLAGGLDADNVAEAIARVQPWGVDASSRLETEPGRKSPDRVRAFVEAVRGVASAGQKESS